MKNFEDASLLALISSKSELFTPKQRVVAEFIMRNYRSLAYVTLSDISKMAKTGQGTVVRFAETLGYKSFSRLQLALREEIENASPKTLEVYSSCSLKEGRQSVFDRIFELEQSVLNETYQLINSDDFSLAIDMLASAPAIVIAATGSNSFLAEYVGYFLSVMRKNVSILKRADIKEMQAVWDLPEGTASLVLSFPRYPRHTQTILDLLKKKQFGIIGISDSIASPIASASKPFFIVPQKFLSFIDPYSAVMSLLHSLLYGVYQRDRDTCRERIDIYNEVLKAEKFFVLEDVHVPDLK